MDSFVDPQARAITEGLPTDVTFIGLLPCVDPLVPEQLWLPGKRFPALTAFKGPLSSVGSLMVSETGLLAEGLPTLTAFVGLLASVCSLMRYQA